jgi:hypothetical protein
LEDQDVRAIVFNFSKNFKRKRWGNRKTYYCAKCRLFTMREWEFADDPKMMSDEEIRRNSELIVALAKQEKI